MAGHSKWAQIKRKKAVTDQKRGRIFTRHAQLIALAAKQGAQPDTNPSLRSAIERAKIDNTPKTVIERAILKGSGQLSGQVEDLVYDVFGPHGSVFVVEVSTDNPNRSRTDIHTVCMKSDARLGERGSAAWMFTRVGDIRFRGSLDEEMELALIEAGAQDVQMVEEEVHVETEDTAFGALVRCVQRYGKELTRAGLVFRPHELITVSSDQEQQITRLHEQLEELEDVEAVYSNLAYDHSRD